MAHTPGPWEVRGHAYYEIHAKREHRNQFEPYSNKLAVVFAPFDGQTKAAHYNAALIAAVPDLLAEGLALANEVRAALTLLNESNRGYPLGWTNIRCLEQHLEKMDAVIAKARGEQDAS